MLIAFLTVGVRGQSAGPESNHFVADGISFDYPSGYSLNDQSTPEAQRLVITRQGSSVQLTILALRRMTLGKDLPIATASFKEPLIKKVAATLGSDKNSGATFQAQIGSKQAEGVRIRNGTSSGEVMWVRWSFRLVGFALIRSDADESAGSQLWQTVSSSFKVEPLVILGTVKADEPTEHTKIESGVLNGRALVLPKPEYPPIARAAHVSGTVTVQVLIDETGAVVSAHAISGHPLLHAAAAAAARGARFSPTLLEGEPVKVTGVIQFNFVAF